MIDEVVEQGKHGLQKILGGKGGRASIKPRQLVKKGSTAAKPGLVGAEDQQNDSMYVPKISHLPGSL